jgi:hypothetical protein
MGGFFCVPSGRDGRGRKTKRRRLHMTDTNNTAGKAPTHIAYVVRKREGKKSVWTRIGAIWPHADGNGSGLRRCRLATASRSASLRKRKTDRSTIAGGPQGSPVFFITSME